MTLIRTSGASRMEAARLTVKTPDPRPAQAGRPGLATSIISMILVEAVGDELGQAIDGGVGLGTFRNDLDFTAGASA